MSITFLLEATTRFELVMEILQTSALPLGDVAIYLKNGAQRRNRTTDTGIFSPLLYRLSYLGFLYKEVAGVTRLELATSCVTGRRSNQTELHPHFFYGGHNRTWTYDPLLVRQVLSQLSYATITDTLLIYHTFFILANFFLFFLKYFTLIS